MDNMQKLAALNEELGKSKAFYKRFFQKLFTEISENQSEYEHITVSESGEGYQIETLGYSFDSHFEMRLDNYNLEQLILVFTTQVKIAHQSKLIKVASFSLKSNRPQPGYALLGLIDNEEMDLLKPDPRFASSNFLLSFSEQLAQSKLFTPYLTE